MATPEIVEDNNRKRKRRKYNLRKYWDMRSKSPRYWQEVEEIDDDDDCDDNDNAKPAKRSRQNESMVNHEKSNDETNLEEDGDDDSVSSTIDYTVDAKDFRIVNLLYKYQIDAGMTHDRYFLGCRSLYSLKDIFDCSRDDPDRRICSLIMPEIGQPLPKMILELDALESLELDCRPVKNIPNWFPSWFGGFTSLKNLSVSLYEGQCVPEEISDLPHLEVLDITGTSYVLFPRSMGNLTTLKELKIDVRQIDEDEDEYNEEITRHVSFPSTVGNLINLKKMSINVNELSDRIGNFTHLEDLCLESYISSLPSSIGGLKKLKKLKLKIGIRPERSQDTAGMSQFPNEIRYLTSLEVSDLSESYFPSLPLFVGELINLEELNLSDSKIKSLPPSIGNLRNLRKLDLSKSKIKSLPPSIGNLRNLRKLDLSHTEIESLPPTISNLRNLRKLGLSYTEMEMIPDEIGNLTNLTHLCLESQYFSKLPSTLTNLKNLQFLNLQTLFLERESSLHFVTKLICECPQLGCLYYKPSCYMDTEEVLKILFPLMWNRAKNGLGSPISVDKDVSFPPSLWPRILEKATVAFHKEKASLAFRNHDCLAAKADQNDCACCDPGYPYMTLTTPLNSLSNAIFQILVNCGATILEGRRAVPDAKNRS